MATKTRVAHIVLFTLQDSTPENRQRLVDSCDKYLDDHPGVLFYAAGARGEEFARPVNDDQYDVGLHVIFEDKAAHDRYQTDPRHVEFVAENKPTWSQIRVFDSYV